MDIVELKEKLEWSEIKRKELKDLLRIYKRNNKLMLNEKSIIESKLKTANLDNFETKEITEQ
jgi:hypothetical protein